MSSIANLGEVSVNLSSQKEDEVSVNLKETLGGEFSNDCWEYSILRTPLEQIFQNRKTATKSAERNIGHIQSYITENKIAKNIKTAAEAQTRIGKIIAKLKTLQKEIYAQNRHCKHEIIKNKLQNRINLLQEEAGPENGINTILSRGYSIDQNHVLSKESVVRLSKESRISSSSVSKGIANGNIIRSSEVSMGGVRSVFDNIIDASPPVSPPMRGRPPGSTTRGASVGIISRGASPGSPGSARTSGIIGTGVGTLGLGVAGTRIAKVDFDCPEHLLKTNRLLADYLASRGFIETATAMIEKNTVIKREEEQASSKGFSEKHEPIGSPPNVIPSESPSNSNQPSDSHVNRPKEQTTANQPNYWAEDVSSDFHVSQNKYSLSNLVDVDTYQQEAQLLEEIRTGKYENVLEWCKSVGDVNLAAKPSAATVNIQSALVNNITNQGTAQVGGNRIQTPPGNDGGGNNNDGQQPTTLTSSALQQANLQIPSAHFSNNNNNMNTSISSSITLSPKPELTKAELLYLSIHAQKFVETTLEEGPLKAMTNLQALTKTESALLDSADLLKEAVGMSSFLHRAESKGVNAKGYAGAIDQLHKKYVLDGKADCAGGGGSAEPHRKFTNLTNFVNSLDLDKGPDDSPVDTRMDRMDINDDNRQNENRQNENKRKDNKDWSVSVDLDLTSVSRIETGVSRREQERWMSYADVVKRASQKSEGKGSHSKAPKSLEIRGDPVVGSEAKNQDVSKETGIASACSSGASSNTGSAACPDTRKNEKEIATMKQVKDSLLRPEKIAQKFVQAIRDLDSKKSDSTKNSRGIFSSVPENNKVEVENTREEDEEKIDLSSKTLFQDMVEIGLRELGLQVERGVDIFSSHSAKKNFPQVNVEGLLDMSRWKLVWGEIYREILKQSSVLKKSSLLTKNNWLSNKQGIRELVSKVLLDQETLLSLFHLVVGAPIHYIIDKVSGFTLVNDNSQLNSSLDILQKNREKRNATMVVDSSVVDSSILKQDSGIVATSSSRILAANSVIGSTNSEVVSAQGSTTFNPPPRSTNSMISTASLGSLRMSSAAQKACFSDKNLKEDTSNIIIPLSSTDSTNGYSSTDQNGNFVGFFHFHCSVPGNYQYVLDLEGRIRDMYQLLIQAFRQVNGLYPNKTLFESLLECGMLGLHSLNGEIHYSNDCRYDKQTLFRDSTFLKHFYHDSSFIKKDFRSSNPVYKDNNWIKDHGTMEKDIVNDTPDPTFLKLLDKESGATTSGTNNQERESGDTTNRKGKVSSTAGGKRSGADGISSADRREGMVRHSGPYNQNQTSSSSALSGVQSGKGKGRQHGSTNARHNNRESAWDNNSSSGDNRERLESWIADVNSRDNNSNSMEERMEISERSMEVVASTGFVPTSSTVAGTTAGKRCNYFLSSCPTDELLWKPYIDALVPKSHRIKSVILDPAESSSIANEVVASPEGVLYNYETLKKRAKWICRDTRNMEPPGSQTIREKERGTSAIRDQEDRRRYRRSTEDRIGNRQNRQINQSNNGNLISNLPSGGAVTRRRRGQSEEASDSSMLESRPGDIIDTVDVDEANHENADSMNEAFLNRNYADGGSNDSPSGGVSPSGGGDSPGVVGSRGGIISSQNENNGGENYVSSPGGSSPGVDPSSGGGEGNFSGSSPVSPISQMNRAEDNPFGMATGANAVPVGGNANDTEFFVLEGNRNDAEILGETSETIISDLCVEIAEGVVPLKNFRKVYIT